MSDYGATKLKLNAEEAERLRNAITLLELAVEQADRGRVWIGDDVKKIQRWLKEDLVDNGFPYTVYKEPIAKVLDESVVA